MNKIAVIGCGNMGRAIVDGLIKVGWAKPDEIIVSHPNQDRLEELRKELGIQVTLVNADAARSAEVVLLGVKPQIIKAALRDLRGVLTPKQVVVSIAAGISTRFIETYVREVPVVRAMPNLPVTVGLGSTAISAGTNAEERHMAVAREIFESVGIAEEVPEYLMDAVTGLSGTGPLYVFHFLEAMADAGVRMGLSRDIATRLSAQTLHGSAMLAAQSNEHPAALRDQVTSPGGTAIAALHVLRKEAFSAIIMDAVETATRRSVELGD